jgi:hypothetical protein
MKVKVPHVQIILIVLVLDLPVRIDAMPSKPDTLVLPT